MVTLPEPAGWHPQTPAGVTHLAPSWLCSSRALPSSSVGWYLSPHIPLSPACPPARENYLFTCSCPKCLAQADDADVTSDEEEEGEGETDDAELEDEMTDV